MTFKMLLNNLYICLYFRFYFYFHHKVITLQKWKCIVHHKIICYSGTTWLVIIIIIINNNFYIKFTLFIINCLTYNLFKNGQIIYFHSNTELIYLCNNY